MTSLAWMAQQLRSVATTFGQDTLIVEHVTSYDDYAEPVYGDPTTYLNCRIEGKLTMLRRAQSETLIGAEVLHVNSQETFNPDDRVTMPDGTTRLVLQVEQVVTGADIIESVLYAWRGGQ